MSIKTDNKLLSNPHVSVTDNIRITYYVTEEGTPITLGGRKTQHGWERTFEHIELFPTFNIKGYNWIKFFRETKLLQIIPEARCCFLPAEMELSKEQENFIKANNLTLMRN